MLLKVWLKKEGLNATQFAARANLAVSTVTRVLNGERRPEWETLDKINAATAGQVTPNDFIPSESAA